MSNDGGPAFPVAETHHVAADLDWTCGMSLLDWFAGQVSAEHDFDLSFAQALAGPMPEWQKDSMAYLQWTATWKAKWRYIQAEALVAEAKRRKQS